MSSGVSSHQPSPQQVAAPAAQTFSSLFINYLAKKYEARRYLEIGAGDGATFLSVAMPYKVAVDPKLCIDIPKARDTGQYFFPLYSDEFFTQLAAAGSAPALKLWTNGISPLFDIIFIDGMHSFEQSWRDFTNSLSFAHKNTLFVLNSTVPADPFSCMSTPIRAQAYRQRGGVPGGNWCGDVFKTVFAIHDTYPELSYCSILQPGSPLTVVWKTDNKERTPAFSSLDAIRNLNYLDMLKHAHLLMPFDMLPGTALGRTFIPLDYAHPESWKKLFFKFYS